MLKRFTHLKSFKYGNKLNDDFNKEWVNPYYLEIHRYDENWVNKIKSIKKEITSDIILKCLGQKDWRSRHTGSYFSAVKNQIETTEIIGVHLLKSEVGIAGKQYAITLASFNSEKSKFYLNEYLDFYLQYPDLHFDQIEVFDALKYLDEINHTNQLDKHKTSWNKFAENKTEIFEKEILSHHEVNSEGYKKSMNEFKVYTNFNREGKFVRDRIKTINKIKEQ